VAATLRRLLQLPSINGKGDKLVSWEILTLIAFGLVFLFLFSGIPVAVGLGLVGIIVAVIFLDFSHAQALGNAPWNIGTQFILVAIPLFILMGQILLHSGISDRLYTGATALLGKLPGGLLHANIASCSVFAAISGSSVATAATIGTVAIPELEKRGYESKIVLGSLAAGGTLGILIPPSICMIIYGAMAEESVGQLFIAGVFPGIMLSFLFMGYIALRVMTKAGLAPPFEGMPWKQRSLRILSIWPVFIIMFVVLGGIYMGVVTPTEAAALGAFISLVFALAFRQLNWQIIKGILRDTVKTTAYIMFLVVGAQLLTGTLSMLRVPDNAVLWVTSLAVSPLVVLIFIYIMYLFLGCFMDGISMMVVTLPVVVPILNSLEFIHVTPGATLIWFGVSLVILVEMAMLTPPVGLNVYVIHGLRPDRPMSEVFRGIIPFFLMMLLALIIVTAFPIIATWLPSTMY